MVNIFNKWTIKKLFQFLIYAILFSFIIFKITLHLLNRYQVKKNYYVTAGKIIKYDLFGIDNNRYLTYQYEVNNIKYKREINGPNKNFDEFSKNMALCSDLKFMVIYSIKDSSKSLINLNEEIQDYNDLKLPKSIKGFQ